MERDVFIPNGGLNQDTEEFFLPKGDYLDAKNIVIDSGVQGGSLAIKKIEGVTSVDDYLGTIKAVTESKGVVYFVTRNGNTARIYELKNDSVSELISYLHYILIDDDFSPDIKVLGDVLVWNYYKGGTPLSWYFGGTRLNGNIPAERIRFARPTPNFIFDITKTISTTTAKNFLEQNDFLFAARYKYDSNEMSAFGPTSIVYKGEPGVSIYTIEKTVINKPFYVKEIDLYVRIGNSGVWRRINTYDVSADEYGISSVLPSFTWSGQTYEAVDSTISGKLFDNIPVETKTIEVADNRMFLGNNQDDYKDDSKEEADITISVPEDNGYEIPTSGTIKNYFSSSLVTSAGVNSTEDGTTHYKAFTNNSEYAVGYAFYDEAMKTRGIEGSTTFQTKDFDYPIIPTVSLTFSQNPVDCFPSWAKYLQILYTKNLNKTFFYEGFASAFWFELQEEGLADPLFSGQTRSTYETRTVLRLSIENRDLKQIKYLVINLMAMFRDELPYNFQEGKTNGDRIRINLISNSSAANNILDMKILGQVGSLLYVEYTGGAINLENAYSYPEKNFFEIYTPKEIAEEENLIFYESGTLFTIDDFPSATTYNVSQRNGVTAMANQQPIGDTIFQKINILAYSESPFEETTSTAGGESAANQIVTVRNSGSDFNTYFYTTSTTQSTTAGPAYTGSFTNFIAGSSLAERVTFDYSNDALQFNNDYIIADNDSSDTIRLIGGVLRLEITNTGLSVLSSILITPTITLYHIDSDGTETAIGTAYTTTWNNGGSSISGTGSAYTEINFASSNHTFGNLSSASINRDINPDDMLRIKVTSTVSWVTSAASTVVPSVSMSGNPVHLQVIGDYRTVTTSIVFDNTADVEDDGEFVVRTTAKTKRKINWNTSSGKPSMRSMEKNIQRKINNIRYGGKFIQGTNINDVSSFFILDRKEVPHENGAIQVLQKTSKLQAEGQVMLCICENETSSIYLNERIITDGAGNSLVAQAGKVLGTVRNLKGSFGTTHRKSVAQYKGSVFWWDSKSKKAIRYSRNGLAAISDAGMKKYFYSRTESPVGYILPVYDMFVLDFGANKAIGFNNRNGRWVSTYNGQIQMAIHVDDITYYFKGELIKKSSTTNYDTYVDGASSAAHLQYKVNANMPITLENITVAQTGGDFVDYSQNNNLKSGVLQVDIENENGQNTVLYDANFMLDSKYLFAHIMRDTGSTGGVLNGDFMMGSNNKIKLTIKDSDDTSNDYKINAISVGYNNSAGHHL